MIDEPLMTINEVAELCAVAPKTVRNWVEGRRIPHLKISHSVRFERAEVLAWLEECRRPVEQPAAARPVAVSGGFEVRSPRRRSA